MGSPFHKIQLIINPAAGNNEPILNTVNDVFHEHEIQWDACVTLKDGDGARAAQKAISEGADLIVVYGGDGTVKDVASGMIDCEVPLAILHGGTGNALAYKLGIPANLREGAELICNTHTTRAIDLGRLVCGENQDKDGYFLLRANIGFHNEILEKADRDLKDRFGNLAYIFSAFQSLGTADEMRYCVTIDDQEKTELSGITCMIANSLAIGGGAAIDLAPHVHLDDEQLDLLIFEAQNATLGNILKRILEGDPSQVLDVYPGRKFYIETETPQTITIDGEIIGETPATVEVVPSAIHILTPVENK